MPAYYEMEDSPTPESVELEPGDRVSLVRIFVGLLVAIVLIVIAARSIPRNLTKVREVAKEPLMSVSVIREE